MNLYDYQERFWQLEEEQPFSPAAAKLFFYWLRRFNKERFKPTLPRTEKQVSADLTMDETTVAKARKQLVERGIMTFVPGNRSRVALWGLAGNSPVDEPKKSVQKTDNASPLAPKKSVHPSGDNADYPTDEPKNSAPYNEVIETSSRTKIQPSHAGAGAHEAEPVSTLPENQVTGAPSPHCAAPSSPLATITPAARALAQRIAAQYNIREGRQTQQWMLIHAFCRTIDQAGKLAYLDEQFSAYAGWLALRPISPIGLTSYLGHATTIIDGLPHADGRWNEKAWADELAAEQGRQQQRTGIVSAPKVKDQAARVAAQQQNNYL